MTIKSKGGAETEDTEFGLPTLASKQVLFFLWKNQLISLIVVHS